MLRIDKIMRKKGINSQDLAKKMHVSVQYVSEVVNEKKNITMAGLSKFANALDVPVAALLEGYQDTDSLGVSTFKCPYCGKVISAEKVE